MFIYIVTKFQEFQVHVQAKDYGAGKKKSGTKSSVPGRSRNTRLSKKIDAGEEQLDTYTFDEYGR